jgi:hypothetical protein
LLDARRSRRVYRINRWDAPSVEVFNATYKADLKAMKNSYMADIVAITGQFKKPLFFDLQNI